MMRAGIRTRWLAAAAWMLVSAGLCMTAGAMTLQDAEQLALQRHPDVALGANAVDAAVANVTVAGQRPNPVLSVQTVNIDAHRGAVGGGNLAQKKVDTTAGLSWLWERGGKRDLRVAGAEAQRRAAGLDLADLQRQQRLAVDSAYYDLKLAQERLRLLGEALELQRKGFDVAQRRQKAGDLSAVDVARLQVEMSRAEADLRTARADQQMAQHALASAIGDSQLAASLVADDAYPTLAPLPEGADALLDALVDQRADVRAALARVQASEQARELAYATTQRDVTLAVSAERYPPDNRGSVGVGFSVPLFWRYGYEGEKRRAETDVEAARLALVRQQLLASTELHQARDQLAAAQDRLQSLQGVALDAGERALRGVELAYARGAAALTDVLDARRQLRALQLDLAAAQADHAKAWAAWQAATRTQP